ncbi:hypothetical protein FACS1894179_05570 [Bacteroidia bacterium]|nr:hypothetical protein FACS1894179_05570 [Bacteroidia bacterium]
MAKENDKIKDLFSSKLKDFESDVPASVWGGLDLLLSQQPIPTADPSSSASSSSAGSSATTAAKTSLLKTVLITIGVAAAIVTGVILIPKGEDTIKPEENKITVTEEPKTEEADTVVVEVSPVILPVKKYLSKKIDSVPPVKEETPEEPVQEKEPEKPAKKEEILLDTPQPTIAELPKRSKAKGLSLSVSASAGLLSENINQNGGGLLFSRAARSKAFMDALNKENKEFKMVHRQPVSFGLKVSKGLTSNLSLETGIVYTYLSSKITSPSIFDIYETQTFHYLGIPVSLNYTFYKLGKADLYLSAGGMIQKDISGKYESSMGFSKMDLEDRKLAFQLYYGEPYFIREGIEQSKPQFSTHLKLGIAYPIYRKLYLYGTIGGAYYFDVHNKYPTIFSDRKVQLDLNLGIKFDF